MIASSRPVVLFAAAVTLGLHADSDRQLRADAKKSRLQVRGSVEQIHVIHAPPNTSVTVRGPEEFELTATTDDLGGLIVRRIRPGSGYSVRVAGHEAVDAIRVLSRTEHPAASFYSAQRLPPSQGYVKTRDGTQLSYRVVLPDADAHGKGPYDVIVTYSGYQPSLKTNNVWQDRPFKQFSALGYAVVGVNMRGTACSGGAFDFMEPLTWLDGYDIVESFAAQPWVDDIALGDQSWPGLTQLYVAATQPPSLDAIVAGSVVGDFYRDIFYPGGIRNQGFGLGWATGRDAENAYPTPRKEVIARIETDPVCADNQSLRGQNVSLARAIGARPYDEPFWNERSAHALVSKIKVPTLQIVSWQDLQVGSRPAELFDRFPKDTPNRLIGVNGFHQYWRGAIWDEVVRFLDIYLGDSSDSAVREYEAQNPFVVLLESDAKGNVRGRFSLPAFAADGQRFRLGDELRPDDADARTGTSTFRYDASRPGTWTKPAQETIAFTTDPLSERTVMAGPGSADLWVAADAEDVDLQVTLSEVRPDGKEMLVQSGWLRASHRRLDNHASTALRPRHLHTESAMVKLVPGRWTSLRIEIFPFAHVFRANSRIRLTVSGPGGAGNAWPWSFAVRPGGFEVRVGHDASERVSSVVLPIVRPNDLRLPASLPDADAVWLQPTRPAD